MASLMVPTVLSASELFCGSPGVVVSDCHPQFLGCCHQLWGVVRIEAAYSLRASEITECSETRNCIAFRCGVEANKVSCSILDCEREFVLLIAWDVVPPGPCRD